MTRTRRFAMLGFAFVCLSGVPPQVHAPSLGALSATAEILPPRPIRFECSSASTGATTAIVRGRHYTLRFGADGVTIVLAGAGAQSRRVRLSFDGGSGSATVSCEDVQTGVSNYLVGSGASTWRTGVRGYGKVKFTNAYPGIDLVFYARDGELEYDFIVAPGANPSRIAMRFDGADRLRLDHDALVLAIGNEEIRQKAPVIYQRGGDGLSRSVDGGYVLDGSVVRFDVREFDRSVPLVIDPVLTYASYLGGSGSDIANAIEIGTDGSLYVLGQSPSIDFPTAAPLQPELALGPYGSGEDLTITKLAPGGRDLIFSTYLGGTVEDKPVSLALDAAGNVYVLASTRSSDFPSVPGSYSSPDCGTSCPRAVIVKLNAAGDALLYSATMAGLDLGDGFSPDIENGIAVDPTGAAVVVGATSLPTMPVVSAFQTAYRGGKDSYVFQLNAAGTGLVYATYLGGSSLDLPAALAIGADGRTYIAGTTWSDDWPLQHPVQAIRRGAADMFLAVLTATGSLDRSTYFGGSNEDGARSLVAAPDGSVVVLGATFSPDLPVQNPIQAQYNAGWDAYVAKFDPTGSILNFATYLGGPGWEDSGHVTADAEGNVYVLLHEGVAVAPPGVAPSLPLPVRLPWSAPGGGDDLYFAKIGPDGELLHGTFIGGSGNESGADIAVDTAGNAYLLGTSTSTNAPLLNPFQDSNRGATNLVGGMADYYIVKFATVVALADVTPAAIAPGTPVRVVITGRNFFGNMIVAAGGQPATNVEVHSLTQLSATLPALAGGFANLSVINPYGEVATRADALYVGTCTFDVPTNPLLFTGAGGTRAIHVAANQPLCDWAASSTRPWAAFNPSATRGSGTVTLVVAPNPATEARTVSVRIAGTLVEVRQGGHESFTVDDDDGMDLLWRHEGDGRLAAWLMDGLALRSGELLSPPRVADLAWKVAAAGDLDGDGHVDLVWQHDDGRIAAWLMSGLEAREGSPIGTGAVDRGWRIRSAGDFNADGHVDLVWQHQTSGSVAIWFMNGLTLLGGQLLDAPAVTDTGWQIVGSTDLNGDGSRDLLWQHETRGQLQAWLLDGISLREERPFTPDHVDDTRWKIRALGDLDGDGSPEFIWQHETSGDVAIWHVIGTTQMSGRALMPQVPDTSWHIVGPR